MVKDKQTRITALDLSKNQFSDSGLLSLIPTLKMSTTLTHLSVSNNALTGESLHLLFEAFVGHPYLTSLELQNRECYGTKLKVG
jgi:hypothetical protein